LVDPNQIKAADERFWSWIFGEDDGPNHPLKVSNGGEAQKQFGNILIVAGSLQRDKTKDKTNDRSLRIPAGAEFVFVPADNFVCTEADGGGSTDQDLIKLAEEDISGGAGKAGVSVNGNLQTVELLQPHMFTLDIQKAISGTGKSARGEGTSGDSQPPLQTRAAAACYYAIIPAKSLKKGDRIEITGRDIKVNYTVK
jgi:hypothetical protein